MLNRRAAQPSLIDEIAAMEARLELPRRHAGFVTAERVLKAARSRRVDIAEELRAESQRAWAAGATSPSARMKALDEELSAADAAVAGARIKLDEERSKYAAAALSEVGPALDVAVAVITDALALADRAVKPLAELDELATRNQLEGARTRTTKIAPHVLRAVREARRLIATVQ